MDTEYCFVGDGVLDRVQEVFSSEWGCSMRPLIIADGNTWQVAGPYLQERLGRRSSGTDDRAVVDVATYLFPAEPMLYADEHAIATVHRLLEGNDLIAIALGSGTINDIVKRASYECGKPYVVVATAPSVDGYTSYGAAVSVGGFKQTLPCPAPLAVFAERRILCEAPSPMIAAGYGDLIAKIPAGADWIVADALGLQSIDPEIWHMIQPDLKRVVSHPQRLAQRDMTVVGEVFSGLVQTGFAMQRMHDSRPASGAEHLISHIWEMEHLAMDGVPVSHGFKVALGTLVSTAMYERLFSMTGEEVASVSSSAPRQTWDDRRAHVDRWFADRPSYGQVLDICRQKFLEGSDLEERRHRIFLVWDVLRKRVLEQLVPFGTLRGMLAAAGCPVEPADIGVDRELFRRALVSSQMIRTRYTILDLLSDLGMFLPTVDALLDVNGYFSVFAKGPGCSDAGEFPSGSYSVKKT